MSEIYQSSHTGSVIDSAVQSLMDFIDIRSNTLQLACLNGEVVTDYGSDHCNYEYNHFYYTLLDKICFITFHMKVNISSPENGYAVINGLPYKCLYDTGLSIYEIHGTGFKHLNNTNIIIPVSIVIQEGDDYIRIKDNSGENAAIWSTGDFWIGASGCYFIQR